MDKQELLEWKWECDIGMICTFFWIVSAQLSLFQGSSRPHGSKYGTTKTKFRATKATQQIYELRWYFFVKLVVYIPYFV